MALEHNFVLLNKNKYSYDEFCELAGKIYYLSLEEHSYP